MGAGPARRLAGLFGLAALATAAGVSILIAGFTAGAVLAAVGEPRRLAQQLVGVAEGFLVPLFFVTLGARREFGALLRSGKALLLLAGLVVAATALHVLVAVVLRQPVAVGLLATAALGVPSMVVSIGLAQGVLDAGQAAAIVSAVLATIAVSAAGGAILSRHARPAAGTASTAAATSSGCTCWIVPCRPVTRSQNRSIVPSALPRWRRWFSGTSRSWAASGHSKPELRSVTTAVPSEAVSARVCAYKPDRSSLMHPITRRLAPATEADGSCGDGTVHHCRRDFPGVSQAGGRESVCETQMRSARVSLGELNPHGVRGGTCALTTRLVIG
jgi:hypothetical protein